MAIDLPAEMPSPSPPLSSASQHYSSPGRHFYVAVDRHQFKMETLVDLLGVAGRRPWLPIVLCCSSRDELDAVCATVSNLSYISLSYLVRAPPLGRNSSLIRGKQSSLWTNRPWLLHLPINPRKLLPLQVCLFLMIIGVHIVESYSDLAEAERASVLERFRQATTEWSHVSTHPGETDGSAGQAQSHMMVVTDACLPMVAFGEAPVQARILINFEIPAKKENYVRRMSACLAADGIVINMVVGGEVIILKALEESSGLVIAEMPINISEIL